MASWKHTYKNAYRDFLHIFLTTFWQANRVEHKLLLLKALKSPDLRLMWRSDVEAFTQHRYIAATRSFRWWDASSPYGEPSRLFFACCDLFFPLPLAVVAGSCCFFCFMTSQPLTPFLTPSFREGFSRKWPAYYQQLTTIENPSETSDWDDLDTESSIVHSGREPRLDNATTCRCLCKSKGLAVDWDSGGWLVGLVEISMDWFRELY